MRIEGIIATTHVDKQDERISKNALDGMAERIEENIMPVNLEHDPRHPPIGRMISAEVVQLPDGEFGVSAQMEIFDEADHVLDELQDRKLKIETDKLDRPIIGFDYSYYNQKQHSEKVDGFEDLGLEVRLQSKKAAFPISELVLILGALGGPVLAGFLKKLGEDAYEALKERIKGALADRRADSDEYLHRVEWSKEIDGRLTEIRIVLSNPSDQEIDWFYDEGLGQLDEELSHFHTGPHQVRRIVLVIEDFSVSTIHAVNEKGLPLSVNRGPASVLKEEE